MTGKTHERGVPLGPGEYHIIADVWTVNQRSEILLTRRHPDKPYGLLWECTGGSVLTGENSVEGALRELSEEVGIHASKDELHLIDRRILQPVTETIFSLNHISDISRPGRLLCAPALCASGHYFPQWC